MSPEQKKDPVNKLEKPVSYDLVHQLRMPIEPTVDKIPLLILMHGLGSNEADLFSMAQHLDKRLLIASVRAPHQIGSNKYSWYDMSRNGTDFSFSFDQLKLSQEKIMKHINQLQQAYNIDETKIFLGGFSQGAIMSLSTALNHSDLIHGAMILSGDLLSKIQEDLIPQEVNKELSIYMSHGRIDAVLPFAKAEINANYLMGIGLDVENHWYDSGHSISQENYRSMIQWLGKEISE